MQDAVTLLGVKGGPAIRPGSSMPTSVLVSLSGQMILVDAGLGVSRAVCAQGVALTDIDAIFITHLHSDHYLELGPLLHTAWTAGLTRSLPVWGPPRLAHYWTTFLAAMEDDIRIRIDDEGRPDLGVLVDLRVVDPSLHVDVGPVRVSAMENHHPPIRPSYAFRFDAAGRSVVLSGDTTALPEMVNFARGADLLVHEAMLIEGVDALLEKLPNADARLREHILRSHTPAEEAGRIATEAGIRQLALTHFVPDGLPNLTQADWEAAVRQTWAGELSIGYDGLRIAL